MTPSPFLKFYLGMELVIIVVVVVTTNWAILLSDDGEQVLVDLEGKDQKQISQHVKKILGKSE